MSVFQRFVRKDNTPAKCQVCGFAGLLAKKTVMDPQEIVDLNARITGDLPESVPCQELLLCVTCFNTPFGCQSDNVLHKRLPAAEYAKDA